MAHSMERFQGICDSLEEKAGVSASTNAPSPLCRGDVKLLQVEELEMERNARWSGWQCSDTHCHQVECSPASRADTSDSHTLRFAPLLRLRLSLRLGCRMHTFPFNPHSVF